MNKKKIIAVILAAGKGKRMQAKTVNKTAMRLAGKPMIEYTVELLKKAGLKKIIIVVGFAKDSIINYLGKKNYLWAIQRQQLGTAHALKMAFRQIGQNIKNILVIQGDDSAFYQPWLLRKLMKFHWQNKSAATFLTVKLKNPGSLGRILRDKEGNLKGIIEVKNAKKEHLKIKEINTGCYFFERSFLAKYLNQVEKDPVSKEYYLPDLIKIGLKANEKIKALLVPGSYFQSVNTPEELKEADWRMRQKLHVK